jgi:hypothetical protein
MVNSIPSRKIEIEGDLIPTIGSTSASTGYSIGSTDYRWKEIWARDGASSTSDRRLKQNISLLSSSYDSFFDALRPSTYQWLNESITHTGFIA